MREFLSKKQVPYDYNELNGEADMVRFAQTTGMLGLPVLRIKDTPILVRTIQQLETMYREGKLSE